MASDQPAAATSTQPAAATSTKTRAAQVWQVGKQAVVSSINPKFSKFQHAFTIATLVAFLTLSGVVGITFVLMQDCTANCRSIPIALLSQYDVTGLSCVGLRTRALKLSLDIFENARQLNRMTNDADKAWKQYTWETSLSDVSKCSFLHSGECGLKEWIGLYQGLNAIYNATRSAAATTWPTQAALFAVGLNITQALDAAVAMDSGTPLGSTEAAQMISGLQLGANTTILQAPTDAMCCNITTAGSQPGTFAGQNSRFVVVATSSKPSVSLNTTDCAFNSSGNQRCGRLLVSAALVIPDTRVVNQRLCQDYYRAGPSNNWQADWRMAGSVCQTMERETSVCLNGSTTVTVDFTNYFTVTGSCTATPPTAVATAKPAAAMQAAATTVLLPLLSEYGRVVGWYLGQGGIDAVAAAAGGNAIKGDNEASTWWMENYMYCCSCDTPDLLSSIGSALGYSSYIEAGVAVVVLLAYLAVCKAEQQRLHLDLRTIAKIAMESDDADKEEENSKGGKGGRSSSGGGGAAAGADGEVAAVVKVKGTSQPSRSARRQESGRSQQQQQQEEVTRSPAGLGHGSSGSAVPGLAD